MTRRDPDEYLFLVLDLELLEEMVVICLESVGSSLSRFAMNDSVGHGKTGISAMLNQQQSEMKVIQSECMQGGPCLEKMGRAVPRSEESINNGKSRQTS